MPLNKVALGLKMACQQRSLRRSQVSWAILLIIYSHPVIFDNALYTCAIGTFFEYLGGVYSGNRYTKEIIEGAIVSEVDVETPAGIITSIITTRSIRDLGLVIGTEVVALLASASAAIPTHIRISSIDILKNSFSI